MRTLSLMVASRFWQVTAVLALLVCSSTSAGAQASSEQTLYRTRAFLDSVATGLERSGKREEAAAIRDRLKVGD